MVAHGKKLEKNFVAEADLAGDPSKKKRVAPEKERRKRNGVVQACVASFVTRRARNSQLVYANNKPLKFVQKYTINFARIPGLETNRF